jgi:hypothetical protein
MVESMGTRKGIVKGTLLQKATALGLLIPPHPPSILNSALENESLGSHGIPTS